MDLEFLYCGVLFFGMEKVGFGVVLGFDRGYGI